MSATAANTKPASNVAANQTTPPADRKSDNGEVLSRLIGFMLGGEQRNTFGKAMALRVGSVICLIAMPWLTGNAINAATAQQADPLRAWSIAAIIAMGLFIVLSFYAERTFAHLATEGSQRLQNGLFTHMQSLSLSFFDRNPIGELLSRVNNDLEAASRFFEQAVSQIVRAVVQVVIIMIVMVLVNWQLTLAALLIVPVMLLATFALQRVSTPAFIKMQEELGKLSGFQEETISGHKVLINHRRQDWAGETHQDLADSVFDVASRAFFTALLQFPLTTALIVVQTVIVLFVGGLMVLNGELNLGQVTAFAGYAALLGSPLSDIANLAATTQNAIAGGRRVFQIMDERPTVTDAPDAKAFEFKGGHVAFKDVDFSYVKGRKILKHNTFEAQPGQKIGLCGPTGAGKSTIINILTRYYDIDSGAIEIDGQNIHLCTQDSLRQQIGVVLQEAFLFTDTVMNNLKYAREGATDEECIAAAKEANAHEFIMNLPQGYDTLMTERGANLSQGQRQMITIARAMVAKPKILVLDEATSNVDTRTEKLIQEGLARLMHGRTSFVIAHRLSTIRDSAKILVINAGEIVEQGPHDELMAKQGFYYTLFMSQFKGKAPGGEGAGSAEFKAS
jgi:ATP-binding cassette subfamily B protein